MKSSTSGSYSSKQYEGLLVLRNLSRAYAEIAALRMQKTRKNVLVNREFAIGINDLFRQIIYSYSREIGKKEKLTFLSNNGRPVAVLFSANTGLYGSIIRETFDLFYEAIKDKDIEVTIIGRLGRSLFLESFPARPYTYFELPDWGDTSGLSDIIRHLVQYKSVDVYYGKFESIVKQVPDKFNIEREVTLTETELVEVVRYIFEPSMDDVLKFFEGEIFGSSMAHILRESQLAKLASRAFAMDRAEQTITKSLDRVKLDILRGVHRNRNRKQMNVMSGVLTQ